MAITVEKLLSGSTLMTLNDLNHQNRGF